MNKIFFFDIDGTLAIHRHIPQGHLNSLKKLKEKGYLTFICTGRAPFYAQKMFEGLVSGYIACNGRYIIYQGQKLHGEIFSHHTLTYYQQKLDELELGAMFVSDEQSYPYHLNSSQIQGIEQEYGKEHITFDHNHLDFYTFDIFYKDHTHLQQAIQAFENELIINDHGGMGHCDCSTINFDKGHAIAYLLKHFDISPDCAYAFGDGYNDQAMFREVGHRIAMGNAVKELKEKATYITDNVDCDGITKALIHENIL